LARKGLNSDGQQFTNINKTNNHNSPQLTEQKKTTTYVENPRPASGQAQQCYGVQSVKRITTLPF
jgi:hypothetical protein